ETRPRPTTRTISKTPSVPRLRWHVSADNHRAENSDHRDGAAAEARHDAAIPAAAATETARPMVPGGLDGERQLLRTGLRQGAARYSQEWSVPRRLAREHPDSQNRRHLANPITATARTAGTMIAGKLSVRSLEQLRSAQTRSVTELLRET